MLVRLPRRAKRPMQDRTYQRPQDRSRNGGPESDPFHEDHILLGPARNTAWHQRSRPLTSNSRRRHDVGCHFLVRLAQAPAIPRGPGRPPQPGAAARVLRAQVSRTPCRKKLKIWQRRLRCWMQGRTLSQMQQSRLGNPARDREAMQNRTGSVVEAVGRSEQVHWTNRRRGQSTCQNALSPH